jgi:hypothetical protein
MKKLKRVLPCILAASLICSLSMISGLAETFYLTNNDTSYFNYYTQSYNSKISLYIDSYSDNFGNTVFVPKEIDGFAVNMAFVKITDDIESVIFDDGIEHASFRFSDENATVKHIHLGNGFTKESVNSYYLYYPEFITVSKDNPTIKSFDGTVFTRDGSEIVYNPSSKRFNFGRFDKKTKSAIKTIGKLAFYGYKGASFTVPENVEVIDDYAFADSSIRKITLGKKIRTIGSGAFSGYKGTSFKIPESVRNIGFSAFENSRIKKFTISNKIRNIGSNAFSGNYVKEIVIKLNNNNLKKLLEKSDRLHRNPFNIHSKGKAVKFYVENKKAANMLSQHLSEEFNRGTMEVKIYTGKKLFYKIDAAID